MTAADGARDGTCELCGLSLSSDPVTDSDGVAFCCAGCRDVYATLDDVDGVTEDDVRDAVETDGEAASEDAAASDDDPPAGHERTYLRVDGMHCTTCEAFLESVATATDGVAAAESSYVTETVRLDYDPDELSEAALVETLSRGGYTAYDRDDDLARQRSEDDLLWRLGGGVMLGMMVMLPYLIYLYPVHFGVLYSGDLLAFAREQVESARYFYYFLFFFTSGVLFYTGAPLLRGAWVSIRTRQPNMDLLVSLAAVSAYGYSTLAVVLAQVGVLEQVYNHVYYDVTVAIVLVVTAGTYYESVIKRRATELLSELTTAQVETARRYGDDGQTVEVDVEELAPGDDVLVREGERVPADGTVREGECTVDEAVVTGESLPVTKGPGSDVVGGSLLTNGGAVVTVGDDASSNLDRIVDLVWDIQSASSGVQKLANRLAVIFVPVVLALALAAGVTYLALGAGATTALLVALTVLIVSCPCALGLATPLAVASGVREAMENGIVVFDETVFERLRDVDVVVFDKTGTLTTGEMEVIEADAPPALLDAAAALERRSSHPAAAAVAEAFGEGSGAGDTPQTDGGLVEGADEQADRDGVTDFQSHATGVQGVVDGEEVLVGHPELFADRGWTVPDAIAEQVETVRERGHLPVVVGRDGTAEGVVTVGDTPRDGWSDTVTRLGERGIEVVVLTGDHDRAARRFRQHPHVDHVFAGVPPEGKAATVRQLRDGQRVAMVGDGTNDAPALAGADLGVALGGGTALATAAADIAIVDDDLGSLETVFELAAASGRRVKQNIGWAFVYNAVAIPLALLGYLTPLLAAAAMASSSLLVVTNSERQLLSARDDAPADEVSDG